MIEIIPAAKRHYTDADWLKTYWLFSFSDYHDPLNVRFGALRVFNDDVVAPGGGFLTHPHREFEIVTIPLSGEITHEDSLGNRTVVRANEVQRMSAGTGVSHAEYNLGSAPVHLYQIWISPQEANLPPSYDQRGFNPASWHNRLFPVVSSGQGHAGAVSLNAEATIFRAQFDAGQSVSYTADPLRHLFLYPASGLLDVNGQHLHPHDQARIVGVPELKVTAIEDTAFVLVDVP